jgi:site-specific DNA recombinase
MQKQLPNQNQHLESPYEGREGLVYARVSSKRQEANGTGLQSQEGRCIAELRMRDVPHIETFPDTFTGGGDFMKRPAMRALLAYVDRHPNKKFVVVFDDLKRFARDVNFHFQLKAAFKARDVLLLCLNFNFEDSPEGEFVETVLAAGAQLERNQNRRQVIQKQKARLELGYWPFIAKRGYKMIKDPVHGKIAVPDEKDKNHLINALEGFANGTFVRKIDACRYLVDNGFWKGAVEKRIVELDKILRSSFYAGFVEYAPWDVTRRLGHHKGLISEEVFNRIQKRLANTGRNKRIRADVSDAFPLRGLMLCADCGVSLTAALSKGRKGKYPYYVCRDKTCTAYGKSIKKQQLEDAFDELLQRSDLKPDVCQLANLVFDRVWDEEVDKFHQQQAQRGRLEDERKLKIKQLTEMVLKARSKELQEVYEAQIEEAAKETSASTEAIQEIDLDIPYRTALSKATTLLRNPYIAWHKVSAVEKQRLYYFIFDRKISYSRFEGYRTAEESMVSSLFEGFIKQNTAPCDAVPCMVDSGENTLNRLKDYLFRFWEYHQTSIALQKALEFA